jgi:hypothetical protein
VDKRQPATLRPFVKEPDNESGSMWALQKGWPHRGGWTVPDVQRFWLSLQKSVPLWEAINSDAGKRAPVLIFETDGKYDWCRRARGRNLGTSHFRQSFHVRRQAARSFTSTCAKQFGDFKKVDSTII